MGTQGTNILQTQKFRLTIKTFPAAPKQHIFFAFLLNVNIYRMESSVMISLVLFERDVYWKIWQIEMFNQCSPDYFPHFRVMLWACEFLHECE